MTNELNYSVLLVGAGEMAIEYVKVLTAMEKNSIIVGRGEESAKKFKEITGLNVETGGINNFLKKTRCSSEYAIVAVNGNQLGEVTRELIKFGIKNILLEKPGGLDDKDIESVAELTDRYEANVLIAYNRRFYASVSKAKEIIKEDGGVTSFYFEFTEWSHIIEKANVPIEVKNRLVLHNSSHVIDLAFYLGGEPININCYVNGGLSWHPTASIFTGAGISSKNAIFSYHSNWDAPGRWGVEILTKKHRLIFRPLEKLNIQKRASTAIKEIDINDDLDIKFKPGLYREVEAFLGDNENEFMTIKQQVSRLAVYNMIIKGNHK